jgi:glyoxylase-like metal-dependent hydrolase (beta-lactamase superfamily II)
MNRNGTILALALGLLPPLSAQTHPAPVETEVAPGVYLFSTAPYSDVGLDGNSVVIVSDDGVLVFDSNGTPAAAAAVLTRIRVLTSQPVKYLVHSHWHWDHWYGAQVYRAAFPGLVIISHEKSRELMAGPAIAFNQPGLDIQLPRHLKAVEGQRAGGKDVAGIEEHLTRDRFFLEQKRATRHLLADLTFTDSLTLHLGTRVVRVLHHDRAITPGDAFLHLPAERIVVTGDLLINPVTFALFSYPSGWIRTLERIDALDAALLVPGHGAVMRDEGLLKATLELLRRQVALGRAAKAGGSSVEQAKAAILADSTVLALRERMTGGEAGRNDAFALYLVDWFVRRLYQELDGPLDDRIPRSP